jgi:hypothetical protein
MRGKSRTLGRYLDIGVTETSTAGTPINVKVSCEERKTLATRETERTTMTYITNKRGLRNELDSQPNSSNNPVDLCPNRNWNMHPVCDTKEELEQKAVTWLIPEKQGHGQSDTH